jgi:hypothetical protein
VIQRAHSLLKKAVPVAQSAFLYWLRIVRWQTKNGLIGQPEPENIMHDFGADLYRLHPRKRFGFGMHHSTVPAMHILNQENWNSIRTHLKHKNEPPIWSEILFEGEAFAASRNFRAAIAYYAFACETFMRSRFMNELPKRMNPNVYEVIDRQINIRPLLERYAARELKSKLATSTIKTIHKLISARDDVVHRGRIEEVSRDQMITFRKATRDLVFEGSG